MKGNAQETLNDQNEETAETDSDRPLFVFDNVSKVFPGPQRKKENEVRAIVDCCLEIPRHKITMIVGENGSGKTTVLRMIGLMYRPSQGNIYYFPDDVLYGIDLATLGRSEVTAYRQRDVAWVFQQLNLISHLNCWQNVALPQVIAGQSWELAKVEAMENLRLFDMENYAQKNVFHLSGGEQQRVAIARALTIKPQVFLADEPTGSLDQKNSELAINNLLYLNMECKTTIVMVTHDRALAQNVGDRIYCCEKRQDGNTVSLVS